MVHKFLAFCFLIATNFFQISAQVCLKLKLNQEHTNQVEKVQVQLSILENGSLTKIKNETVAFNKLTSEVVIEAPKNYNEGIYLLSINGSSYFEVVITYDEMPVLIGTLSDFTAGNVMIKNSIENEAYYNYLSVSNELDIKSEEIRKKRFEIKSIDNNYYTKQKELEQATFDLQKSYNQQLNSLKSKFPSTITSNQIIPIAKIPIPTAQELNDFETNESFLRNHYLKNLNLNNSAIKNNYLVYNKLKLYLETYTPNDDTYHQKSIDKILNFAQGNQEMIQLWVEFLMGYYYKERRDELVLYVYNVYNSNYCNNGDDNLNVDQLIQNLKLNRVGNPIHELYLPNSENELISLKQIAQQNKATLLLFWSANCTVCMEELPSLYSLYQKYKHKGLAVYAVNLDMNRELWLKTIEMNNLKWININELQPKNQSQVEQKYKIRQTPTLFVIDDELKIIAKDLFGLELEAALGNYIHKKESLKE